MATGTQRKLPQTYLLVYLFASLSTLYLLCNQGPQFRRHRRLSSSCGDAQDAEEKGNWRNLSQRDLDGLSMLGKRMILDHDIRVPRDENFTILIWRTSDSARRHFIYRYGETEVDPFEDCSVRNCQITYRDSDALTADAIYIHLQSTKGPFAFPPRRGPSQMWIWHTDESPLHSLPRAFIQNLKYYNGFFNWSMTYRMDSDIPVPYGRTLRLPESQIGQRLDNYFDAKPKSVAVMMSNCEMFSNMRLLYVKLLQRYIDVDFYGKCGTLTCPGHYEKDCDALKEHKFYLAFENSDCQEYITEKVWWSALGKGAVPVVMGGEAEHYKKVLPPNSFLHVDDFNTPKDLAERLRFLASHRQEYMRFHHWRRYFRVAQEHGFFGSPVHHYCRICESLNYNDLGPKVYDNMEDYWGVGGQCRAPSWVQREMEWAAKRHEGELNIGRRSMR
ncbi:3-galactosyl-N-acetylglucosaminide 4-alpha-L-fucosyltransferase FUT3-like [Penaeus japonicus]|uniref:3-galactosyl-N-acetylglucosaminide 4-alpha-L-fucosyltransferase FUT3-like n=1 Tax=Penaeus japonicus TaxID=27405 RepID=UPI001C710023|nr:3-galactosyl-N-acetylglucosaminide 4-alpha-L-fucosyltransferase FUT3-like [Penaeus japonicus]